MWYSTSTKEEEFVDFRKKTINKILGIETVVSKKHLGQALNLMRKYFPEHYNFFPKTYTLPTDVEELEADMATRRCYYISKPNEGS